ncbi:MAG: hypothetical protein M4579_001367 [Chaenotheca gracillima]|nr:MAG: hypothetical protein M4579_001367 [Chaenotheca gracillima]
MPAKRRPPPKTNPKPQERRSKLARENNISAAEEAEIKEAFELFGTEDGGEQVIHVEDVRRALIALNVPPTDKNEMREILDTLDPSDTGEVSYEPFLSVCGLKMRARVSGSDDEDEDGHRAAQQEEVEAAFRLFLGATTSGPGRGGGGNVITLAHLKRVVRELKEDEKVGEEMLRDMIAEANGGAGVGKGVNLDDFEGVMRRAGVFR